MRVSPVFARRGAASRAGRLLPPEAGKGLRLGKRRFGKGNL